MVHLPIRPPAACDPPPRAITADYLSSAAWPCQGGTRAVIRVRVFEGCFGFRIASPVGMLSKKENPVDVADIPRRAQSMRARLEPLYEQIARVIIGQRGMVDRLLVGLLTGGHIL